MTKDEQFEAFWASFPNKKGKGDAAKAFKTAIKLTTLEAMLDGISRYVANKPDWQAYKYPGPWLRDQRWADEWEPTQAKAPIAAITTAGRYESREDFLAAERRRSERSFS